MPHIMALFRGPSVLLLLVPLIGFGGDKLEVLAANNAVINGAWSPWSRIETPCLDRNDNSKEVVCGGGIRLRYRSCTNPTPQNNGAPCAGNDTLEDPCNTNACQLPGDFLWSPWSPCSKSCGRGKRSRYTMCGAIREKTEGAKLIATTTTTTTTATTPTSNTTASASTSAATSNSSTPVPASSTPAPASSTPAPASSIPVATRRKRDVSDENLSAYELEYEERCTGIKQKNTTVEDCNTWDRELCPSPCANSNCPPFAKCLDTSTDEDPSFQCECQMGTIMKDDGSACIAPPPTTPTPRPIPTLPDDVKAISSVITRGASTLIIIFLSISLGIFLFLGIFDPSRVIHMNMEIALLCAHICLLPALHEKEQHCRVISILTHFFFTACFFFMFLESVHLYSLVAWVVHRGGLLTRLQNTVAGWGCACGIVLFSVAFEHDSYGGAYHCWLQMDTNLIYGQYLPIIVLVVLTFAIVEAAGSAVGYERLDGVDKQQRTTAKIMQGTLIFILPLIFASYIIGTMAEYEQNIYLYSTFTLLNGIIGGVVFFFHCSANESVRRILGNIFCKKKEVDDGEKK